MDAAAASVQSWALPRFVVGCFLVSWVWDISYSVVSNFFPIAIIYLPVPIAMLAIPIVFCFGLGLLAGEWSRVNSRITQIGAAAWCVVVPNLAFVVLLFISFALPLFHNRTSVP